MALKLASNPTETRVQTRDGRSARILAYIPEQKRSLIAIVKQKTTGEWVAMHYTSEGLQISRESPSPLDLINAPREWWINIFERSDGAVWAGVLCTSPDEAKVERVKADNIVLRDVEYTPVACVRVTEDQFDD